MSNKVSHEDLKSKEQNQDKKEEVKEKIELNDLDTSKDPKGGLNPLNPDK